MEDEIKKQLWLLASIHCLSTRKQASDFERQRACVCALKISFCEDAFVLLFTQFVCLICREVFVFQFVISV
jgi:hypothetical protein